MEHPSINPVSPDTEKRRKWRLFTIGLAVRLAGVALIWLGDGDDRWFRKAVVVLGVALSIGGITVLRYMLFAPLLARIHRKD